MPNHALSMPIRTLHGVPTPIPAQPGAYQQPRWQPEPCRLSIDEIRRIIADLMD